ncbi:hypothetical protein ACQP1U_17750 [Actinomycetota bacterium]
MAQTYTVSRTTTIAAPADRIHALIRDFHEWVAWSPWEGLDPEMRRDYSEIDRGVDASNAWEGDARAGKSSMEITGHASMRWSCSWTG